MFFAVTSRMSKASARTRPRHRFVTALRIWCVAAELHGQEASSYAVERMERTNRPEACLAAANWLLAASRRSSAPDHRAPMNARGWLPWTLATLNASSASAAVINQRAVAGTYVLVFAGFAALLLVLVLGLVAASSAAPQRRRRLRTAFAGFALLGVIAIAFLAALREFERYSALEDAFLWCGGLMVLAGAGLVVHALVSRRARGP